MADVVRAWNAEAAAAPEFAVETVRVVTGLLLPIWTRLPGKGRVYRLQTDAGERIIGRLIDAEYLPALASAFGFEEEAVPFTPAELLGMVRSGKASLRLSEELSVRLSRVMNAWRVEVTIPSREMLEPLKACGLLTEIIDWKTRLFLPLNDQAAGVLSAVLGRYPLLRLVGRIG